MKIQSCHVGRHRRHSSTAALASMLLLLSLQTQIRSTAGFLTPAPAISTCETASRRSLQSLRPLHSEVQTSSFTEAPADDDASAPKKLTGSLEGSVLLEYELADHKPLGCSVEESLADEPDGSKYVFVAEVTHAGNAAKAGLKEGDVIVQLSGTFDEVVDVTGLGIEKIRSLVGGRPEDNPLVIRVARGSDVRERHELSLVELCIIGDEAATAECISSIYAADDDIFVPGDGDDVNACDEDDGTECMLDSMWDSWSEGLPGATNGEEEPAEEEVVPKKKKVQPWASRSSGSGTYVRDPKTGKMVNIDE